MGVTLPSGATSSYGYDAGGRQVSQPSGGSTTNYLWDEQSPNGDIVLQTDSSGNVQASDTLDGQGTLLAETHGSGSSATTSYVLPDGQGSVRALANSSGAITDTYRYDAFGNVISSQGATPNPYGYDSQRYNAATGLYQLRARSYDPSTGRFLSPDTASMSVTNPTGINRYLYASSNPINVYDPTGHDDFEEESALYQIQQKTSNAEQRLGLQDGWLDAVITAALVAEIARDFTKMAVDTFNAGYRAELGMGPPPLGQAGVGLALYQDPAGFRHRLAAENDVGLVDANGIVALSAPAYLAFYSILDGLLVAAGFDIVHEGELVAYDEAGGLHEERWLVQALEEQNVIGGIRPESYPVIGVSQNTICGTCLADVFQTPADQIPQGPDVRDVLPYTGCVLNAEEKIYVAAAGRNLRGDNPGQFILPQEPEQDCALLLP